MDTYDCISIVSLMLCDVKSFYIPMKHPQETLVEGLKEGLLKTSNTTHKPGFRDSAAYIKDDSVDV